MQEPVTHKLPTQFVEKVWGVSQLPLPFHHPSDEAIGEVWFEPSSDLDELLVMLAGEAVLVEDDGETAVRPGDILAWPAGAANGHHLQNRGEEPCVFVVASAGDFAIDGGEYPDIDMRFSPEGYFRRDGSRYETERIP